MTSRDDIVADMRFARQSVADSEYAAEWQSIRKKILEKKTSPLTLHYGISGQMHKMLTEAGFTVVSHDGDYLEHGSTVIRW